MKNLLAISAMLAAIALTACQHPGTKVPQPGDVQPSLVQQNQAKLEKATTF